MDQEVFAGNELWRVSLAVFLVLAGSALGWGARLIFAFTADRLQKRAKHTGAVAMQALKRSSVLAFMVAGFAAGVVLLDWPQVFRSAVFTTRDVLLWTTVMITVFNLVDVPETILERIFARTPTKLDDMMLPIIRKLMKATVIVLGLVQIAQVLSKEPITSIIAGLGIGGLAVALAAQESLSHFFGSIALIFDKPFQVGDRVVIDGYDGPVESIGLRSTQIRTLEGHLVTIPNGKLANKNIQNIGERPFIRRIANITITYDTPPEKVDRAIEILQEELRDHEGMDPDFPPRVYFNEFNDASLNLFVIYWYHPPAYWDYMAFNDRFNRTIFRRFNEEGIDFAFPTQTLYLAGDPNRPLNVGLHRTPEAEPIVPESFLSGTTEEPPQRSATGKEKPPKEHQDTANQPKQPAGDADADEAAR